MLNWMLDLISGWKQSLQEKLLVRRWNKLRALGMHIGAGVLLPETTWIDVSHCNLISIGDNCGFGPQCLILAHDAQMDEFIDAARVGRVIIHPSSHIGARTVILPGVEIGPRTIVWANSVVSKSLPADSVCAGNPAKVICTLQEYLEKHKADMAQSKAFPYLEYDIRSITPERNAELLAAVSRHDAYVTGGHTAELNGLGATPRTPKAGQ